MANTVYTITKIELSDGSEILVKPLTISGSREFNKVVQPLREGKFETEDEFIDILIAAGLVCMKQLKPELSEDKELFENVVEMETLVKILELAGGLVLGGSGDVDPNQLAGLVGEN